MPITAQQAWDATDPSQSDDERERAAQAIVAGVAANDAYLASRDELERLKVLSSGQQVPPSHASINPDAEELPTGSDTKTAPAIDGTVEEEPQAPKQVTSGAPDPGPTGGSTTESDPADQLRQQLRDAGLTPEV